MSTFQIRDDIDKVRESMGGPFNNIELERFVLNGNVFRFSDMETMGIGSDIEQWEEVVRTSQARIKTIRSTMLDEEAIVERLRNKAKRRLADADVRETHVNELKASITKMVHSVRQVKMRIDKAKEEKESEERKKKQARAIEEARRVVEQAPRPPVTEEEEEKEEDSEGVKRALLVACKMRIQSFTKQQMYEFLLN